MAIAMTDIHSIGGSGNGLTGGTVSFSTPETRIDFLVSYDNAIREEIETLILNAATSA
jgi:hypothetical protein